MAIDLTTPETVTTQYQGITAVMFTVPHSAGALDKNNVVASYEVRSWDSSGNMLEGYTSRSVVFPDWPVAFKEAVRDMYALIEQDAQNQGLIGAGTGEVLE